MFPAEVIATSKPAKISEQEAIKNFGGNRTYERARESALLGFATQFGRATVSDVKAHPFKYAAKGVEVGAIVFSPEPVSEFAAGAAALQNAFEVIDALTSH